MSLPCLPIRCLNGTLILHGLRLTLLCLWLVLGAAIGCGLYGIFIPRVRRRLIFYIQICLLLCVVCFSTLRASYPYISKLHDGKLRWVLCPGAPHSVGDLIFSALVRLTTRSCDD